MVSNKRISKKRTSKKKEAPLENNKMKNKEFYKRLANELHDNMHNDHKHLVKDLKITSLEQVLGIVRSVMIRNNSNHDEALQLRKNLKHLMEVLDISEKDL